MEISELEALRDAGTVHSFRGSFGGREEGARGTVVQVGSPANPDVVVVRDTVGNRHTWNRQTVSIA
jgi:hypothetical protein